MNLKPKDYKPLWQHWKQERMDAFVVLYHNAMALKDNKVAQVKMKYEKAQLEEMDKRDGTKEFEGLLFTLESRCNHDK